MTMREKLAKAEAEIRAIKNREVSYTEENRWDEMVPWFDLTDNERANAIEYWS